MTTPGSPSPLDLEACEAFGKRWGAISPYPSEVVRHIEWLAAEVRRLRGSPAPAPASPPLACKWKEDDDGVWHTDCDHAFFFDTDGPKANQAAFCIYCGKPLEEVPHREEEEAPEPPTPGLGGGK